MNEETSPFRDLSGVRVFQPVILERSGVEEVCFRGHRFLFCLSGLFERRKIYGPYLRWATMLTELRTLFGNDYVRSVVAYHSYSGSGEGTCEGRFFDSCPLLDFPSPHHIEGPGGLMERLIQEFPIVLDYMGVFRPEDTLKKAA